MLDGALWFTGVVVWAVLATIGAFFLFDWLLERVALALFKLKRKRGA